MGACVGALAIAALSAVSGPSVAVRFDGLDPQLFEQLEMGRIYESLLVRLMQEGVALVPDAAIADIVLELDAGAVIYRTVSVTPELQILEWGIRLGADWRHELADILTLDASAAAGYYQHRWSYDGAVASDAGARADAAATLLVRLDFHVTPWL